QKNILLTSLAFFIGLTLHLAETTTILLILGVATISTWWQWRPEPTNVESEMILETLTKYPAVLIKNYSHIIAFNSNPPCLAAAYQSPIPVRILKYCLDGINLVDGTELSISTIELESFLLVKTPLTRYRSPRTIFQTFQGIISRLELQLQTNFNPAERYQILRLFGLENYLEKSETASQESTQPRVQGHFKVPLSLQKVARTPVLLES
ncbi:MAG: hypothetical protein ACFFBD_20375, partial [Candidatus Hodarchaeota archaeon]